MSRPALCDSVGPLKDLIDKISGDDGPVWLGALNKMLRKEDPWPDLPAVVNAPPPAVKLTFAQAMEKAYDMIGAGAEYALFVAQFGDAQTPGKWTLAMIQAPDKLTVKNIIAALRSVGSKADTWYNNPDTAVPDNARNCNQEGSYFLDLQPNADPDPENAGKSQNDLKKSKNDKVSYGHITWLERWFLELVHFLMAGVNLDMNGIWTICAGSLDSDGDVPCVYFDHGHRKVCGSYCSPRSSHAYICARSAVPRQPQRVGANS